MLTFSTSWPIQKPLLSLLWNGLQWLCNITSINLRMFHDLSVWLCSMSPLSRNMFYNDTSMSLLCLPPCSMTPLPDWSWPRLLPTNHPVFCRCLEPVTIYLPWHLSNLYLPGIPEQSAKCSLREGSPPQKKRVSMVFDHTPLPPPPPLTLTMVFLFRIFSKFFSLIVLG